MMISALVLINCRFPLDRRVVVELIKLAAANMVQRTTGIYDLIVKISADTENNLRRIRLRGHWHDRQCKFHGHSLNDNTYTFNP